MCVAILVVSVWLCSAGCHCENAPNISEWIDIDCSVGGGDDWETMTAVTEAGWRVEEEEEGEM